MPCRYFQSLRSTWGTNQNAQRQRGAVVNIREQQRFRHTLASQHVQRE